MNIDPRQTYRKLSVEYKQFRELKANADHDLLLSAKHPGKYTPENLESIRRDEVEANERLQALSKEMRVLEDDPAVHAMLLRDLGITSDSNTWEPELRTFSEIEEMELPWLWAPFLPLGRLTILEGDPGQGKSWFSLAIATCLSVGGWIELIDNKPSWTTAADTIYVTCEDDPEDTIKRRLRILQADQSRVHHLSGKARLNARTSVTMTDLVTFRIAIERFKAKLLIIDPLAAYVPRGVDMSKGEQMRPVLDGLAALAKQTNVAVLVVRHLSKGNNDHLQHKGAGTVQIFAAARSVLVCGERTDQAQYTSPTDGSPPRLVSRRFGVAQAKGSSGFERPSVEFEMQKDSFLWVGPSDVTVSQLLTPQSGLQNQGPVATMAEARRFILGALFNGEQHVAVLLRIAKRQRIDELLLKAAAELLGIIVQKRPDGEWWTLPDNLRGH